MMLLGLPGARLLALIWVTSAVPTPAAAVQPLQEPRSSRVEFVSPADGVRLVGDLYHPRGPRLTSDRAPGIVLLGVTGPNDRALTLGRLTPFSALASHLAEAGMAVLTFDDRGVGESGGDWAAVGHDVLIADALSALRFLSAQSGVDSSRVGYFGLSEGAGIAMMAAAVAPRQVAFLVLGSPPGLTGEAALAAQFEAALSLAGVSGAAAEAWRERYADFLRLVRGEDRDALGTFLAGPGALLVPPYAFVPRDPAGRAALLAGPWYRSQLDYDPGQFVGEIEAPVLIVGGALDPILPPDLHHPPLREGLGDRKAEIHVIPGVNHLLLPAVTGLPSEYATIQESADPRVLHLITSWLERRGFLGP